MWTSLLSITASRNAHVFMRIIAVLYDVTGSDSNGVDDFASASRRHVPDTRRTDAYHVDSMRTA